MDDYKLKLLPIKELVSKVNEMNIKLTEVDLYHPNSRRITMLFEMFIYMFSPKKHQLVETLREEAFERLSSIIGSSSVSIYKY